MKKNHLATINFILYEIFRGINVIKCHLSRIMGEKKLRVADVARSIGIHRNAITLLYEETATRIDLDTINKLCIYLDCKLDELFEFIPD